MMQRLQEFHKQAHFFYNSLIFIVENWYDV